MIFKKMNLIQITLALTLCLSTQATAKPSVATHRRGELPPRLSDTLAVAKSPLEPVTVASIQPNPRNDGQPSEAALVTSSPPHEPDEERKQATRSADSQNLQNGSSSPIENSQDSVSGGSTQSAGTEKPEEPVAFSEPTTTTTVEPTTEAESNREEPTTTTTTTTSTTTYTTTTTQSPPDAPKSDNQPPSEAATSTTEDFTTTTAATKVTTTEQPTTTTPQPIESETVAVDAATITTTTTPAPSTRRSEEVTTVAFESIRTSTVESNEAPSESSSGTSSTESIELTTTTNKPDSDAPVNGTEIERDLPASIATSGPTTEEQPDTTTTTAIPTTPTTTTTTTTAAPSLPPVETTPNSVAPNDQERTEDKSSCDHLPSYSSDEIQKVFREETTFKNGTIKGKFTYINFDQRYRLVHYTRLPYGPVKIDLVEELGRPKQDDKNQTSPQTLSEVPNAVLQLRNLLPNSLFGFPFLGPNSGQLRPRDGPNDDEKSNMYFYSTDSLATPNLLSPRVPVSVLPGQRVKLASIGGSAANDPLSQAYLEQPVANNLNRVNDNEASKPFGMPTITELKHVDKDDSGSVPNQFHYASSLATHSEPSQNPLVYSYYGSSGQPVRYQYAPISSALFQPLQARALYQSQPLPLGSQALHHAHQPHGHEHYSAQYMLSQSPSNDAMGSAENQAYDNSRLRLRVKTSKSLNVDQGSKSAQMRLQSSEGHLSAPVNSPMQMMHQRNQQQQRRLGKQSHQLRTTQTNQSPVVYHVLRNPSGRGYNQYNQDYAVAYDHK